jgi:hypothetical protein
MSKLEQQITDYLASSEETIITYTAPDLSEKIWQKHQKSNLSKYSVIAASICLFSLVFWLQQASYSFAPPSLIAQSQSLELKLEKVSATQLSDNQQLIIENWQYELELIDENIELQSQKTQSLNQKENEHIAQNLWANRTQLLTQMIDFYLQPIDLYEI